MKSTNPTDNEEDLYAAMWERVQTFPLAKFVTEVNFKIWFDQMVSINRLDDIDFCVNYAKSFSGSKSYTLVSEYQNILAWDIKGQSIFSNARDVLETLFFVADAQPLTPDLVRGLRNEIFAREEYQNYLNEIYSLDDGYKVIRREDLKNALTKFKCEIYEWFGGSPDDVFEITQHDKPFKIILPDYKVPRPDNIDGNIQNEYRHQLHHYDLGFDLMRAEFGDRFPEITDLVIVKYNVIDQSITPISIPKDSEYKSIIVDACQMWWNEYALKGAIPPLQNAFQPIITPSHLSEITSTVLNQVRVNNEDFSIPKELENKLNAIPTSLYDYGVVKALANEADSIATEIKKVALEGFNLLSNSGAVIPKSGIVALGGAEIKWQEKQKPLEDNIIDTANKLGVDLSKHATTTYDLESIVKDMLETIDEKNLDTSLAHCYETVKSVSVTLSRKRTGPAYEFVQQIKSATHLNINKLLETASGFYTNNVIEHEQDSRRRAAYQNRSIKAAEHILAAIKDESRSQRIPVPRDSIQYLEAPPEDGTMCFISSDGVVIEISTGEIIGAIKSFDSEGKTSKASHEDIPDKSKLITEAQTCQAEPLFENNNSLDDSNNKITSGMKRLVLGNTRQAITDLLEGEKINYIEARISKAEHAGLHEIMKENAIDPAKITDLISGEIHNDLKK